MLVLFMFAVKAPLRSSGLCGTCELFGLDSTRLTRFWVGKLKLGTSLELRTSSSISATGVAADIVLSVGGKHDSHVPGVTARL